MSGDCCEIPNADPEPGGAGTCGADSRSSSGSPAYRRVLWIALVVNAAMFVVELVAGAGAGSAALRADALDFLADAGNYAISLFVLSAALHRRARASLLKGVTMAGFGLWVVGDASYRLVTGAVPEPFTMGIVGLLALAANLGIALLLFRFRRGDSNMRSVWLCTRNDAIGNVAVTMAALGVFTTRSGWPDAIVALVMATLALSGATQIIRHARTELRTRVDAPAMARSAG